MLLHSRNKRTLILYHAKLKKSTAMAYKINFGENCLGCQPVDKFGYLQYTQVVSKYQDSSQKFLEGKG